MRLLALGLLFAGLSLNACGDAIGPQRRDLGSEWLESASRAEISAAAAGRNNRGFEDEILRMEATTPGLGGVFFDPASGRAVAYVRNLRNRPTAMQELRAAAALNVDGSFRAQVGVEGATVLRDADYAFSELVAWSRALASQPRAREIVSIDADERINRVRISVTSLEDGARALQAAAKAGVPEAAVSLEVREGTGQLLATVQNRVRATAGGLQIRNSGGNNCTLGFTSTSSSTVKRDSSQRRTAPLA